MLFSFVWTFIFFKKEISFHIVVVYHIVTRQIRIPHPSAIIIEIDAISLNRSNSGSPIFACVIQSGVQAVQLRYGPVPNGTVFLSEMRN